MSITVEEYIAENAQGKMDSNDIIFLGFEAEPSHVWSEHTTEEFSCKMLYDRKSNPAKNHNREFWYIFLGEEDVCEFLNRMFPTTAVRT